MAMTVTRRAKQTKLTDETVATQQQFLFSGALTTTSGEDTLPINASGMIDGWYELDVRM